MTSPGGTPRRTLGAVFDPKRNALNAMRLLLALSVVVWHAFALTGTEIGFLPVRQVLGSIGVDSFFAISGFLIVSSWVRNPRWLAFLRARALRIFPAFWVCLIVTAGVFAPVAVLINGGGFPPGFGPAAIGYLFRNFFLLMGQYGIAGTPTGVALPGVWDGSLWTLFWEFLCYLGVLVIGLAGLFRWKTTLAALFGLALVGVLLTSYGPLDNFWIDRAAMLGIMFLAGALVFQFRDRLPVTRPRLAVAALLVAGSAWLPDYRVLSAIPLAYLVISLGALGRHPRLRFTNDISYGTYIYGFPMQQLLATAGAASLGVPAFAILSIAATIPIAAASWFLIERPALRLKGRRATVPV